MKLLFFQLFLFAAAAFSQIQVFKPVPGFQKRITDAVNSIWIIDTHEHLETEDERLQKKRVDFTYLFRHYAREDLVSAGMDQAMMNMILNPDLSIQDRWILFKPYWEATRNTAYLRVPLIAARDLYGIDDINDSTYQILSEKMQAMQQKGLYRKILKERAHIELSIQDRGHQKMDREFYRHVERFTPFFYLFGGNDMIQNGKNYGVTVTSLDSYLQSLRNAFEQGVEYGMVAVKIGVAYNRILQFNDVSQDEAEQLFTTLLKSKSNLPFEQVKPFQDFMLHKLIELAREYHLPVQIHTGLQAGNGNIITNSKPTHLVNLFMKFPEVNFVLMHSGYPYGGELSTLAKNFPNVFIDMTWTQVISPSYSIRNLSEWLETVPSNKIMAFGGDYNFVEGAYAHSVMARQVVATVLIEKVRSGYLSEDEAIRIAGRLLRENAITVFQLDGKKKDKPQPEIKDGFIKRWLALHESNEGFVRDWMIIGPFALGAADETTGIPQGFVASYAPEKELDFSATYKGMAGPVRWQKTQTPESGYLNLKSLIAPSDMAIAYAYAEIVSPDDREIELTLGSNDGAKLWVNNELIFDKHMGRGASPDQDFLKASLKKGANMILVKVENLGANWGLYIRLIDPKNLLQAKSF